MIRAIKGTILIQRDNKFNVKVTKNPTGRLLEEIILSVPRYATSIPPMQKKESTLSQLK